MQIFNRYKLLFSLIILSLFLILSLSFPFIINLDKQVSLVIYDYFHSESANNLFGLITDYTLGTIFGTTAIFLIILAVKRYQWALSFGIGAFVNFLVVAFLKDFIHRPRPFSVLTDVAYLSKHIPVEYSFPSGHTALAFFIAYFVCKLFRLNKILTIMIYVLAIAVGVSRVYLGAHYLIDVLAGGVIGTISAIGTILIVEKLK